MSAQPEGRFTRRARVAAGLAAAVWLLLLLGACRSGPATRPVPLDSATADALATEVAELLAALPERLAREGPSAWLDHFVEDASFTMASDGAVAFDGYAEAAAMLAEFAPTVVDMELVWEDLRVEVLAADLALVISPYHERFLTLTGEELLFAGCVSALVVRTPAGWRLQHLHWSSLPPSK